ncbi:flavodoxin [Catalinimonas sp. 4WD22]|uniref:flavodoxin n=1 Tax=Catalinimonas locisalis TaxID=3133978 RepID=UPI0031013AB4
MTNEKIGLFYGSDTGYTEGVANQIQELVGASNIEVHDINRAKPEDFAPFQRIIIGLSTWHDGELQSDWDAFYENFKTIDFNGKTVAFFGLGDQIGYAEYFIDGVGILGDVVYDNGGQIVGVWPTDGYDFEVSKAEFQEGWFLGLAIDEDNQPEMTVERVEVWVQQIIEEFAEVMSSEQA